ncbi:MAG: L-serine ammonia-lyase, iron-sulfur-dependent, subunit alpha [Clostridia bacterium]|nr:L-serine ammonia-lyase, iron-sulfur-dependent, subunit alpha [Clostridia bacterium]
MKSLRELYKIGRGPSSSHTMGPERACNFCKSKYPDAESFKVILYGSLSKTGEGHGTDRIIRETFAPKSVDLIFDIKASDIPHPNTMDVYPIKNGVEMGHERIMSVGGGMIEIMNEPGVISQDVYRFTKFSHISEYCKKHDIRIWEYVLEEEGDGIFEYLNTIWDVMKNSVKAGIKADGMLPGGLEVHKKAKKLFNTRHIDESVQTKENRLVCAYAFAVSEENADGGTIVTAPTCGSAGVLPAVLYYEQETRGFTDEEIVKALATAGIVGNIIKTNASISGAECGCQAEIGSACSMAAAALGELFNLSLDEIEYATEIAMEHHLGLTCDPVGGLVQIPCIERNAVAAMRAINAISLANFLSETRKISFDLVVEVMYQTGKDLKKRYRETSEGGLAKLYKTMKK